MGFFGNNYNRYGYDYDSYDSMNESVTMPMYNNRYSNIHDMYEVACQLEIDGNDLIHEMEMNILMNEHNYFVEHGHAVQYSDRHGYLTEEGNSVWQFIQKAWETLMKYLDQCISWIVDKCREYIIYFRQTWAQKFSVKDGIKGFEKSIVKAAQEVGNGIKADVTKTIVESIVSDLKECTISALDAQKLINVYPKVNGDGSKIETKGKAIIDTVTREAIQKITDDSSSSEIKDAIYTALGLDKVLGDDKEDATDERYICQNADVTADACKNEPDSTLLQDIIGSGQTFGTASGNFKTNAALNKLGVEQVQKTGARFYKLLQKDFSDSLKDALEAIRDKKKDLHDDRIENRDGDGDNEVFKKLKKKIQGYNLTASSLMKSYGMKISVCVKIVNKCVSCLNKIKNTLKEHKDAEQASGSSQNNPPKKGGTGASSSFKYTGGYQAIF